MPDFVDTEQRVCSLFKKGTVFTYDGKQFKVLENADKPTVGKGECKTDVYFKASSGKDVKEFKISVKKGNADFLENKMSYERAEEIFGEDVDEILSSSILSIKKEFENQDLVTFNPHKHTKAKCIKLGWKFELVNKANGELSGKLNLTTEQKEDVYRGTNLPPEKKDAMVNGKVVNNSGVADLITVINPDEPITIKSCLKTLVPIRQYIEDEGVDIFFACKALNFRATDHKWDGNRPLAVYVDWYLVNNKLEGKLNFSSPLLHKGDEIGNHLLGLLDELHINEVNFDELENKMMPDVNYYKV